MFTIRTSWRRAASRLALVSTVGIVCLIAVPMASASSIANVRSHIRRADHALTQISGSGSAQGDVAAQVPGVTSQLGAATDIGVNMAVHAHTRRLRAAAARVLSLVANADARAESVLSNTAAAASGTASVGVLQADVQVAQADALTLQALVDLGVDGSAQVSAAQNTIATVSATAETMLADLVTTVTPGCTSTDASVSAVVSDIPASVDAELNPVSVTLPEIGSIVNGNGSLLVDLVSQETADTQASLSASADCAPASGSDDGSGSGTGGSATGSGSVTIAL
jgi:hypothetical protein